ncbi:MAG: nicotinamide mononucleotide transporter [Bacteroidetes bacterium]|nr:nicotinamide mononucleotide transporter [Bacteroidota bacterium]MBT6685502.1 nicotinamide mononucleotide transporter [Bacteroidota bacterium]MBT7144360.1 nicotinamide mononucleotide transporter [Bacteroidota bacterium]MBT7491800.1 nicotinamide mononucleotide transporter [Bacteroidota bacterium]
MIIDWFTENYLEVLGTISGLLYLYFSVKQNIWLWPLGIISSILYIYVFFVSKFYADMSLQFYYVFISIYGWIIWSGNKNDGSENELKVSKTKLKSALILTFVTLMIFLIYSIILNQTDSTIPYWDAFTTSASIVATWMLAHKKIEHWIIWIIVDLVSLGLYIYKGLYATSFLFFIYSLIAVIGYFEWKKEYQKNLKL